MSTPGRKFEVEAMFCTWLEISHTNNKTDRGASNVCLGFSSVREHKLNAPLKDVQPRWLSNGIVEYVDSMHRNLSLYVSTVKYQLKMNPSTYLLDMLYKVPH
jgi:hypothetical protein